MWVCGFVWVWVWVGGCGYVCMYVRVCVGVCVRLCVLGILSLFVFFVEGGGILTLRMVSCTSSVSIHAVHAC